jgi:hypothetical protein
VSSGKRHPAKELDALLVAFYVDVKKDNGAKYEPGSVNLISASIERHLGDAEYPHSLRNKVFDFSTRALSAKKVKLQKQGNGLKPNASKAVSTDEKNLMWEEGQLGDSSPRILIFSLWYYLTNSVLFPYNLGFTLRFSLPVPSRVFVIRSEYSKYSRPFIASYFNLTSPSKSCLCSLWPRRPKHFVR